MRRVARDGSSQYFINQSTCRLTDVVELLAQVGLGKELHSIIGQGKVESFLAGKPEDRRSQIEEAAGLGAYKRRRERAELKLREVRRNLERALLLEREVGSQLAPLRRQATAAEQMRTVESEIAETRGRLLTGDVAGARRRARGRAAASSPRSTRSARRTRAGSRAWRPPAPAKRRAFARKLAERERSARRLLRARVLDGRLESVRRLAEQRQHLLDEVRARGDGRARAPRRRARRAAGGARRRRPGRRRRAAWRASSRPTEAEHAQRRRRAGGGAGGAGGAARGARPARGGARERAGDVGAPRAPPGGARPASRSASRRSTRRWPPRSPARRTRSVRRPRPRPRRARRSRAAEAAAAAAAAAVAGGDARASRRPRTLHRATLVERRALEAEADHLRAALRDLEDVGGEVLEVAGEFPGTVSLAGERLVRAGLRARPRGRAGAALGRARRARRRRPLVAARRAQARRRSAWCGSSCPSRRRPSVAFPGAAPLADKVSFGEHEELEGALADVVIVDDLRAVPDEFTRAGGDARGRVLPARRRPDRPRERRAGGAAARAARVAGATGERSWTPSRRGRSARRRRSRCAAARQTAAREAAARRPTAEREARIAAETAERGLAQVRAPAARPRGAPAA